MALEWIHPDSAAVGAYDAGDPVAAEWLDAEPSEYLLAITHYGDEGVVLYAEDPAGLVRLAEEILSAARALLPTKGKK